jgi:hypothetical protein
MVERRARQTRVGPIYLIVAFCEEHCDGGKNEGTREKKEYETNWMKI